MAETAVETGKKAIETYLYRYPQLTLPIEEGMRTSEACRSIVRKGKFPLPWEPSISEASIIGEKYRPIRTLI